ncbi:MAG: hypothetical protein QI199_04535 [Candidatus Korarchaeota archaeon]|nr:hypothetical protein [Candidatus Korarchaeota archaeon]
MDLVEYLSRVFLVLRKTTLFSIIRKLLKKERDYGFVDTWVLVNTIASAIFSLMTLQGCLGYLGVLIWLYGCYRVSEILIYQIMVVVLIHGLIGIFLMLVVIARFVSMIPPIAELLGGVAS